MSWRANGSMGWGVPYCASRLYGKPFKWRKDSMVGQGWPMSWSSALYPHRGWAWLSPSWLCPPPPSCMAAIAALARTSLFRGYWMPQCKVWRRSVPELFGHWRFILQGWGIGSEACHGEGRGWWDSRQVGGFVFSLGGSREASRGFPQVPVLSAATQGCKLHGGQWLLKGFKKTN